MHLEKGFTLKESNYTNFMARIHQVPITANAINEFCDLPDFKSDEYSSLMSNIESENLQEILEELTVPSFKWAVSTQEIHTCRREYLTPLAKQRVEESDDPKDEEDPTKIELIKSTEIPDKAEPMEPEAEPDVLTSMFRTQSPRHIFEMNYQN
ncbi:hypothetical protein J1N35_018690 [Gossypium stocksii]|uniref:Uncharacterized protein n=1 Tax=Gossypium stocksii TaxID=47602 RepID=A0A9D4A6X5_9ROSI|nr:hypothetical protein J1N35_018690 [Gossypium stocksii]